MTNYGYSRVSTTLAANRQSLKLQNDALTAHGVNAADLYSDRLSGTRNDRPEQLRLLELVQAGDCIIVWKLDRWARSLSHLTKTLDALDDLGVGFHSLTEALDTKSATGRLLIGILGSVAAFERDLIVERTLAGLAASSNKGGRPQVLNEANDLLIRRMKGEGIPVNQIAKQFNVSRGSVYRSLSGSEPVAA